MNKKGIENLKKALSFGLALVQKTSEALSDGKLSWSEGLTIALEGLKIPPIIRNRKELLEELKNLDNSEKNELYSWAQQEFNLPNDKVEHTVESALMLMVHIVDFAIEMHQVWTKKE